MNSTVDSGLSEKPSPLMFWGCFIALVTTAFAFISRTFMINTASMWPKDFDLDKVQAQELFGAGIWPFAISIILFSLVVDKIGYRVAMFFSFACYTIYAILALVAYNIVHATGLQGEALKEAQSLGWNYLYVGSIILGLGNGTVEAFINPVVATMFKKEKTKWLNILHAGWPGGLVFGGLITIGLGTHAENDWRLLIYIIAIPAVIYLLMLIAAKFPVSERVAGGATYKQMLGEFGICGAFIATYLIFMQMAMVVAQPLGWDGSGEAGKAFVESYGMNQATMAAWVLIVVSIVGYGWYCRSLGRPLMILLCLVMMPLATTELGTDGAITGIMEVPMKAANYHVLWVLVYTSAIMMVLRFFAGPVVKAFTPLGLLAACSALAIVGLFCLSITTTFVTIFMAATLYGIGKTYFWPTMLGVVAEQYPKGGALTLNAISGIGMLTVGIIGGPLIGKMQEDSAMVAIETAQPGLYETIMKKDTYFFGAYTAIDDEKVKALPENEQEEIKAIVAPAKQGTLAKVTVFPAFMLICYIGMILFFKSKGGYKPQTLDDSGH